MAEYPDREHFIPLRKHELIELLCANEMLKREDRDCFRQFCQRVTALFHLQFNQRLEQLKTAYAPFDPDSDTQTLVRLKSEEKQQRLNSLLRDIKYILERANYIHLSREDIEASLQETSDWGIEVQVNFKVFEHLAIFARGDVLQKRTRRRVRRLYREEEALVPTYQRLVILLKLRPDKRQAPSVNTNSVYMKIFKDIPKVDLKMLLPSAQVRLSLLDRCKIGGSLAGGIGTALWNLADETLASLVAGPTPWILWALASAGIGYGYKSYSGYQQTKERYNLTLLQGLYFQNLDSNAGVLFRLLDEAEEQECREAFLAYFFLWHGIAAEGCTSASLDDTIEQYLEHHAQIRIDFEVHEALRMLERLRLVEKVGDYYRVPPIAQAITQLDESWNSHFHADKER